MKREIEDERRRKREQMNADLDEELKRMEAEMRRERDNRIEEEKRRLGLDFEVHCFPSSLMIATSKRSAFLAAAHRRAAIGRASDSAATLRVGEEETGAGRREAKD